MPPGIEAWVTAATNAHTISLAPQQLHGLDDPSKPQLLVNFIWQLHGLVAEVVAQQAGFTSEGHGGAALDALGAWSQYRRLVTYGEFDQSLLVIPAATDPNALGKIAGWAAAGERALSKR